MTLTCSYCYPHVSFHHLFVNACNKAMSWDPNPVCICDVHGDVDGSTGVSIFFSKTSGRSLRHDLDTTPKLDHLHHLAWHVDVDYRPLPTCSQLELVKLWVGRHINGFASSNMTTICRDGK